MTKNKISNSLTRIFYLLFAICFTFVVLDSLFKNPYHKTKYLIPLTVLCVVVLYLVYMILRKYSKALDKNYKIILIVFAAIMFIIELIIGNLMKCDLTFDIGSLHKAAIEWVETGTFKSYYDYYSYFPNNLGGMTFLYIFFKLGSFFGIKNYFSTGVFVMSIMIVSIMVLVSLICKKFCGARNGIFALALFALSPQVYFIGGSIYTDTLSMLFPVLLFFLYLMSKEKSGAKKFAVYLLMGLAAGIGCMIKFTVIIIVIAVIIYMCLHEKLFDIIKAAVCMIGITVLITALLNSYMYSVHLDKDLAEKNNTPVLHWVMMGLKGNGAYNPADYELTRSLDYKIRDEYLRQEIATRLNDRGFSGICELIALKSARDFGDGTYGIADTLSYPPERDTVFQDWVVYTAKHYSVYSHIATAVHMAIMIFMLALTYVFIFNKKRPLSDDLFVPYLTIFGIWLFLLFWESNRRYFSNFAPMIFICACAGIETIVKLKNNIPSKESTDAGNEPDRENK